MLLMNIFFLFLLIVLVGLGVGILLLHELLSSLKRSSLDVLSSLWEEVAELIQVLVGTAHEDDVWQVVSRSILLVIWSVSEGLEKQIGLEVVEDLVVSKVGVFGQVKNGFVLDLLVIFVVVDFNEALSDEKHFLDIALVADHHLAWVLNSTEHIDNHFIGKSSLAFFKEVIE